MRLAWLKEFFAGFLRTRHIARHFRRLALLDTLIQTGVSREVPATLAQTLVAAAESDPEALLKTLDSHADGLTETPGRCRPRTRRPQRSRAREAAALVAAPVALLQEPVQPAADRAGRRVLSDRGHEGHHRHRDDGGALDVAPLLAGSQVQQGGRQAQGDGEQHRHRHAARPVSDEAAPVFEQSLRPRLQRQAAAAVELPISSLVPGDVVVLSAGDMIPADCRILRAQDLFVNQAAMTGESLPVEKYAQQRNAGTTNPLELDNILFMGTNVVSGSATAVVVTTGNRTYFGALAQRVTTVDRAPTQFQAGVNQVAWLLIRFMFVMAPLVLLINGFTKHDWLRGVPVRAVDRGRADARDAADDRDVHAGQGRGAAVAPEGHRQAAGRDPELRRDGRAVHRQDRHADAGQDRPGAPHRRLGRAVRRGAGVRLSQQPLPDRPEEPARRGRAGACRGARGARGGDRIPARSTRSRSTSSAGACRWWWPSTTSTIC